MRQIARRSDIRDLILDAVDALLAKFGYRKMTMEDVARQVGIGKGTIYLHFPSKEELVLSHIDRIGETVILKLQELAGSADPAERRLRRMLVLRVLHRFDSVAHYTQSLGDLLSSVRGPLLIRRQATFEKEAAVFEDVLREGARLGALDCPDPRTTSLVLIHSTNSLLPFSLSPRELGRREELEDRVGRIADLLIKGLLPCPSRPASWTR
ncbi:MAG: TetR/AcrR family transcriptional regulator [Candidatus Aminicenantes bacterium]|nr:TetR/AcrR family transcriptional regulator [Candidatus Aminicenantes bacterium]NTV80564.1 TetR/AcrR family transcriptional regulator [Candidatus Aminicenantes bacterium]